MQRFHPASRPDTLSHKARQSLENRRFMPVEAGKVGLAVAGVLGMDEVARVAVERLLGLVGSGKTGVAGCFMADAGVSARLAERGIEEQVEEADFFRFRRVVIPFGGISLRVRRAWEAAGHRLEDFTAPQVRRAQVALGLFRMEGAQGLIIGRHDDAESQALMASSPGSRILQDTTDTARLEYAPAFGVVCQTHLSPRRVAWLVQQLRFRYRDARVTFLDTGSPAMAAREDALEKLLVQCERVVIVGRAGEASCEALVETALRRGKPAIVVEGPGDLDLEDFRDHPRVALTAGAFALDATVHAVAEALLRR